MAKFHPKKQKKEEYDKEEYIEMRDMKKVRMGLEHDQTIVWLRSCANRLGISVKILILTEETRKAGF